MSDYPTPCRLGRQEYDGHSYCYEHGGFAMTAAGVRVCDRRGAAQTAARTPETDRP